MFNKLNTKIIQKNNIFTKKTSKNLKMSKLLKIEKPKNTAKNILRLFQSQKNLFEPRKVHRNHVAHFIPRTIKAAEPLGHEKAQLRQLRRRLREPVLVVLVAFRRVLEPVAAAV